MYFLLTQIYYKVSCNDRPASVYIMSSFSFNLLELQPYNTWPLYKSKPHIYILKIVWNFSTYNRIYTVIVNALIALPG